MFDAAIEYEGGSVSKSPKLASETYEDAESRVIAAFNHELNGKGRKAVKSGTIYATTKDGIRKPVAKIRKPAPDDTEEVWRHGSLNPWMVFDSRPKTKLIDSVRLRMLRIQPPPPRPLTDKKKEKNKEVLASLGGFAVFAFVAWLVYQGIVNTPDTTKMTDDEYMRYQMQLEMDDRSSIAPYGQ